MQKVNVFTATDEAAVRALPSLVLTFKASERQRVWKQVPGKAGMSSLWRVCYKKVLTAIGVGWVLQTRLGNVKPGFCKWEQVHSLQLGDCQLPWPFLVV